MATIITVHGTNTTGPEEGEAWWQRGSEFEKEIRALVESDSGAIDVEPLIWDGLNSETARRKAASALYSRLLELDAGKHRYCLIGHSHGGSIVSLAVTRAAFHRNRLSGLSRWITVGTPFVLSKRAHLLFNRTGVLGRSIYIAFSIFFAIVCLLVPLLGTRDALELVLLLGMAVAALVSFFVIPVIALWFSNRRTLYMYTRGARKRSAQYFAGKWDCLFHPADEAIGALSSLRRLKLQLFRRDFATSSFASLSLFAIPIGFAVFLGSSSLQDAFKYYFPQYAHLGGHEEFWMQVRSAIFLFAAPLLDLAASILRFGFLPEHWGGWLRGWLQVGVGLFVLFPLATVAACLTVTSVAALLGYAVSWIVSIWLDQVTLRQVRRRSFGNDDLGGFSWHAQHHPDWTTMPNRGLPSALADEIRHHSDSAATDSLSNFRGLMSRLVFSEEEVRAELFTQCLTWAELIHTSYFASQRFRLLVVYAISQAEGFRPSAAFKSHPDYAGGELVRRGTAKKRGDRTAGGNISSGEYPGAAGQCLSSVGFRANGAALGQSLDTGKPAKARTLRTYTGARTRLA